MRRGYAAGMQALALPTPRLESITSRATGWHDPEARLDLAFEREEFVLFGQPVALADAPERHEMVEAFVRLREEETYSISPGVFLPILAHHGMLPLLDRWLVKRAIEWLASLRPAARPVVLVTVGEECLDDALFPPFVQGVLRTANVAPARLCFQIPHAVPAHTAGWGIGAAALKAIGCPLAITGVGRGQFGFERILRLGPAYVKLDGSLVRALAASGVGASKAPIVCRACRMQGIFVIAEDVESPEMLAGARDSGAFFIQGAAVAVPRQTVPGRSPLDPIGM
jgi:EAL domain-containing protein (putative c-di-GMP-specific phosphodiesterase class I)